MIEKLMKKHDDALDRARANAFQQERAQEVIDTAVKQWCEGRVQGNPFRIALSMSDCTIMTAVRRLARSKYNWVS